MMLSRRFRPARAALLTMLLAFAAGGRPSFASEDAAPLMREVWTRMRSLQTEREKLTILVVPAPGKPQYTVADLAALTAEGGRGIARKRAVRSIGYSQGGQDRLHIVFSEPAEDLGTAFLVWRRPEVSQDDQWLYLPALGRPRRLPASSTQTFAGSNFTYEDIRSLTSEPIERFDYEIAGEEVVDGQPCTIVRARPKEGTSSAYATRTIAIAKGSLFPLRSTFHDAAGQPWKVLYDVDPKEVAPNVWRPTMAEMRDLKLNETTIIVFEDREVNPVLSPAIFTQDHLETGGPR
jgi:hypothetical protein